MTVVTQSTAPTIQVIIYQVIVRLQLLPVLLPQVQLLPVVEVASNRKYLVLEFNCLIPKVPSLVHFLKINQFVCLNVKLEHFLVEAFTPASAQDVDEFAF